ncbi:MAG: hypothetical protein JW947_05880 [Sedimentisphaerales bacterium]|nr:hypothetical protein [Sedimentisphaerales bacterium]
MQVGRAIVTAGVVLTLAATIQADPSPLQNYAAAGVILTLNGLEAASGFVEVNGKDNLVIAVGSTSLTTGGGDTEVEANAWRMESSGGVLEEITGGAEYSFRFEDELMPGVVRIIANNDMVIDGVLVKGGDVIYELYLFYTPETDIVTAFGLNLEILKPAEAEAEVEAVSAELAAPIRVNDTLNNGAGEAEVKPAPQGCEARPVLPRAIRKTERKRTLKKFAEIPGSSDWGEWEYGGAGGYEVIRSPQGMPFGTSGGEGTEQREIRMEERLFRDEEVKRDLSGAGRSPSSRSYPSSFHYAEAGESSLENYAEVNAEASGEEIIGDGNSTMEFLSSMGRIEIPNGTVINTNTVWETDVNLLGAVYVEEAMLVIKPGVTIRCALFAKGIVVRNNGCIIANGTPDDRIYFLPWDVNDIGEISIEDRYRWIAYEYGIKLEETASELCEISYCAIGEAYVGICNINNRLERPIHDNSFFICNLGVGQKGPMLTDVVNNEIIDSFTGGVWIKLADVNGSAARKNEIYIGNNTIVGSWLQGYGQIYGMLFKCVQDPNNAGMVIIANNIIAASYLGSFAATAGWLGHNVASNGHYANYGDPVYGESGESPAGGSENLLLGEMVLSGDPNSVIIPIDDFDSYASTDDIRFVWKDWNTQEEPKTSAECYQETAIVRSGNSMRYWFRNADFGGPYYSEVRAATVNTAEPNFPPNGLGIDPNWLSEDTNTLALWFYGDRYNSGSEQMYIKLTDGGSPPRTGKVVYDGTPYDMMEERWQVWNVPLQAFVEANDVNLANIQMITLGFGEGGEQGTNGTVYFDDIVRLKGRLEDDVIIVDPYAGEPVFLSEDPFVNHYYGYPLFLEPNCPLMNAGYGFIDEYPDLIGKASCMYIIPDTNYYLGMPDAGRLNIGYHYFDWYFVNAGDGNELSADLNQDCIVNFGDFAILADGWRDTYDINDLSTMANEWLRIDSGYPPIAVNISGDLNNLAGDVAVGVSGYGLTTARVFVLMDGQYIGELEYFDSNTPLLLKTNNYMNGGHSFKVVAVDANRFITVSETPDVNFNNAFYNIIAPEYFYPTDDYKIWGFHDGNDLFEAKLTNHNDQILWSNNYSGSSANIVIPGAAFGSAQLCKATISSSSGDCEDKIHKKFVKEDFIGAKMILLLPNPDVIDESKLGLICTIISSCETKGVPYGVVCHKDNTPENWKYIFILAGRKDIYYAGHANSHVGEVQRTHLECWKDGKKIKAFSYTTQYETDASPLPNNWDIKGFDLRELNLKESDKIGIGWFDGCRTAGYETKKPGGIEKTSCMDLAETFGFLSLAAQQHQRSIFFGWRMDPKSYPGWPDCYSFANSGQKLIWSELGTVGVSITIAQALEVTDSAGLKTRQALWGEDAHRFDDGSGYYGEEDNNLVNYGFGNISVMKLEPN